MMKTNGTTLRNKESGQTLVLFAGLVVALLAILALVLDGGNIYLQRRFAQNAADAGAIAGALVVCRDGTADAAEAAALNYAVDRNRADTAVVTVDGWTVTVVTTRTVPTAFAGLVGINQLDASAAAVAECGPVSRAMGIAPIAIHEDSYWIGWEGTIWDDDEEMDPATGNLSGSNRGWLSPAYTHPDINQEGAANLKPYMRDGFPGWIDVYDWVRPSEGNMAAVIDEAWPGQLLLIPVFDEHTTLPNGRAYYHIVAFGVYEVWDVVPTGSPKGIVGQFVSKVHPQKIGEGPDGGLRSVNLVQ
jgi:hypothetical protein